MLRNRYNWTDLFALVPQLGLRFGEARKVILTHLGNRYGRRFGNHWEFVRYAREHNLGLDFTTPPRRPDPKQTLQRMLEALDATAAR